MKYKILTYVYSTAHATIYVIEFNDYDVAEEAFGCLLDAHELDRHVPRPIRLYRTK